MEFTAIIITPAVALKISMGKSVTMLIGVKALRMLQNDITAKWHFSYTASEISNKRVPDGLCRE